MKPFLTLLFLSFLCTCVSAQNDVIDPENSVQSPAGSGSLLVEFGNGTWIVSLSSGTRYEKFKYVTNADYRRRPSTYTGYTIVPGTDRYDLRMVHQLIGQLSREGWELIATNYTHSQSANDWGTATTEKIFYQFRVPVTPPALSQMAGDAERLLQVAIADRDQLKLRGALSRKEDGMISLKMEELVGGRWIEYYSLVGQGILKGDAADRITAISASENKLSFRIGMANGNYDYHFTRGGNNGYYFTGVRFQSGDDCGMVQYNLSLLQSVDALLTGYYQPEPCMAEEKPRQLSGRYPVRRTWLKDFVPGSQRIEIADAEQTVFY